MRSSGSDDQIFSGLGGWIGCFFSSVALGIENRELQWKPPMLGSMSVLFLHVSRGVACSWTGASSKYHRTTWSFFNENLFFKSRETNVTMGSINHKTAERVEVENGWFAAAGCRRWVLLMPRVPNDPRSCQMDGCATSTKIGSWFSRYTCKKASGHGVRTHPPMVLLAMVRERDKSVWPFSWYQEITFLFVWRFIYSARSTIPLINGGEIFYVVMMTLGGSRTIITLRAADRDRGRWCGCQRSWEVIMWNDRRKWLVVTSSCPLTLQVAERGPWLVVVITCKPCLTSVNDPDNYIQMTYVDHPDVLCKPSGCYVYKCRLIFLEVVRIGKAHHVYFIGRSGWGRLGWQCVPCVTVRCVPRVLEGRGPYSFQIFLHGNI